jgi:hypothetical protein
MKSDVGGGGQTNTSQGGVLGGASIQYPHHPLVLMLPLVSTDNEVLVRALPVVPYEAGTVCVLNLRERQGEERSGAERRGEDVNSSGPDRWLAIRTVYSRGPFQ